MSGFNGKTPREHIVEANILTNLAKFLKWQDFDTIYGCLNIFLYVATGGIKDSNKVGASIMTDLVLFLPHEKMTITVRVFYQQVILLIRIILFQL